MRAIRAFLIRLSGLFRKKAHERELREEFEAHLAMHMEDNMRAGMNEPEARRQAVLKLGGLEATKEAMRERATVAWLETTLQDIRYAWRGLRRNPAFALTAVLSLALGLGASLAIFTVADNLLLRPLPYPRAAQLVMLWDEQKRLSHTRGSISPAEYFDWKKQRELFESVGVYKEDVVVLDDGGRGAEVKNEEVSIDLLPMLGVRPLEGRLFGAADSQPRAAAVMLISYRLWQGWFGGQHVIGRAVRVNGSPYTIVGVMPAGFYFPRREADMWEPLALNPAENYRAIEGRWLECAARLKPGVASEKAQAAMDVVARRQAEAYPAFSKNWTIAVEPLRDYLVVQVKTSLLVLLGAVALLLAVACANVANLFLARYSSKRREMALRFSLGAGRWRIVRQLLTESILLSLMGGALGMLLARWAVVGLVALAPASLTRSVDVEVDLRIYAFAAILSVLSGVLFGLAPAIVTSRAGLSGTLHNDNRSNVGSMQNLRAWFVGAEVTLSVILLAGGSLLFRTVVALQSVDPGLDAKNVLTSNVVLPSSAYQDDLKRTQVFERISEAIRRVPGVRCASAARFLPFDGLGAGTWVNIAGRPAPKAGEELLAGIDTVLPGYFTTMGTPLLRGRDFNTGDEAPSAPWRFLVNEAFTRKYLAGEDALDKKINALMSRNNPFGQIIGVVGDVRNGALNEAAVPTVYYLHSHLSYNKMNLVVRGERNSQGLVEALRTAVKSVDPALTLGTVRHMDEIVAETFARQRFSAILLAGFSISSLALAAIGVYGVLAYSVSERTREIGVRVALGAEPGRIASMVLSSGARLVAGGLAAGMLGALALTGFLKSLLFGVGPRDPFTFGAVTFVIVAVALVAAYVPARRAARLEPMVALRAE